MTTILLLDSALVVWQIVSAWNLNYETLLHCFIVEWQKCFCIATQDLHARCTLTGRAFCAVFVACCVRTQRGGCQAEEAEGKHRQGASGGTAGAASQPARTCMQTWNRAETIQWQPGLYWMLWCAQKLILKVRISVILKAVFHFGSLVYLSQ